MRRNNKNIRHKKAVRIFEIPWDEKSTVKTLQTSVAKALLIALKLMDQVAAGVVEEVMNEEAGPGPVQACRRSKDSGKRVSFS